MGGRLQGASADPQTPRTGGASGGSDWEHYADALKVEVYGTADYEDPHAQEIAKPEGIIAFKVINVYHDHTHKVMIGTIKWCVLVTMAVMVTDGTVVVGPDTCVWIKKDIGPFLYNTMPRQLQSKFFDPATFACYAAVHPLLNHHSTMPVTLKTALWLQE
ncbi:hypothetical protein BGZ94_007052 [Podila epigama]|nr:hypothetical protein BGZ94_007052 [Podila epigama]